MRIPFRLVDVFAERPLAGNQLCVVPDPIEVPDRLLQALASEIGFSETTFVTEAGGDRYSMRIFTTATELPFAGHPTLGTAFVLVSEGRIRSPTIQTVAAGEFPVEVDVARGFARMRQHPPSFGPLLDDPDRFARAVGLEPGDLHPDLRPQIVSTGLAQLLVPARAGAAVGRAAPDPARVRAVTEALGVDALYLFAARGDRAKARLFGAGVGVDEDPATGSAAGPLGAYLVEHGVSAEGPIVISQGSEIGRPSTLRVEVRRDGGRWEVRVGGGVFIVGEGWFELPDGFTPPAEGAARG